MPAQLMNTKEVAAYLQLNEKKIYALAREGRIPAVRLTGKWLFPREELDAWLAAKARGSVASPEGGAPPKAGAAAGGAIVVAGSDDPLLRDLLRSLGRRPEMGLVAFAELGSAEGVRAAAAGQADLAGCHLSEEGEFNLPFLPRLAPGLRGRVVTVAHRRQGLLVAPGNPLRLRGVGDLGRPGVRIVNRQPGAGTRLLLDRELARAGIDPGSIPGYGDEVSAHLDVAVRIFRREADAGLACETAARMMGLGFVPVCEERYDLIVPEASAGRPGVASLMAALRSADFRRRAEALSGYDPREAGVVQAEL